VIRGVLFDLDGTLLDTATDLVGALNHVRDREGLPEVAVNEFRHLASKGAAGLIAAGMPGSDEATFAARKARFLEYYAANSTRFTKPFEGVLEMLERLRRKGIPWGVVTNKHERLALPLLRVTGLLGNSSCVVCGDSLALNKPDPAPVRFACRKLAVAPGEALMVGDDVRDIDAGRAAGTRTALAAYGYVEPNIDREWLSGTYVIRSPGEVLDLIGLENGA
jgi:2-phosphoglycolate phosphatase